MQGLSSPPLLPHEEEPRCHWRGGRADDSRGQGFGNLGLHGGLLWEGEVVQPSGGKGSTREEVNGTVVGMMRWKGESPLLTEYLRQVVIGWRDPGKIRSRWRRSGVRGRRGS